MSCGITTQIVTLCEKLHNGSRTQRALVKSPAVSKKGGMMHEATINNQEIIKQTHRFGQELALCAGMISCSNMTVRVPAIITDNRV
ncbi:MAG: hypothetical protein J07HQW1_01961 [Haloquadratum walsbyi J07HQW1]|uniref:Uncharacterized protein n=1 Tax=Haloquadratum walsbyi J07HQW1 TaxID=1238424 RepID=U1PE86_9EURY|nr:MAG: hypothetical protein J07HQW1_01961 [Haloquadratum walsbyi J07HQW1]